jgi:hypothetical protein
MSRDIPGAIDTPNEYISFTLILLFIGGLFGGLYLWENPNLEDRVYALTHESPEFSGEKIVFQENYDDVNTVESLNKIYRDTDTEYGWCLRIESGNVTRLDTFTRLNETTPGSIRFSCNPGIHNGIMHTHPDGEDYQGITALSEQDKKTLRNGDWIDASCVIGGEISIEDGIEGVGCWKSVDGEIQSLEVSFS